MVTRSISDLKELTEEFKNEDLFQVSRNQSENKFSSQKITYQKLQDSIVQKSIITAGEKWSMGNANITNINNDINTLKSAIEIKQDEFNVPYPNFKNTPRTNGECIEDVQIPNKKQVIELVQDYSQYISPDSFIQTDPNNDQGYTEYDEYNTYIWTIDSGNRDSSKSKHKYGKGKNSQNGGQLIQENGILTIYGWLTADQGISAQEAWVGLYGRIFVANGTQKWVLLQVQPWIVGAYSNVAQYIGFQIPVKSGLELKIMTGFKVDGTTSGLQNGNTLMFKNIGNIPNAFVGYIIKNI